MINKKYALLLIGLSVIYLNIDYAFSKQEKILLLWQTTHGISILPNGRLYREKDVIRMVVWQDGKTEVRYPFLCEKYSPVKRGKLSPVELARLLDRIRDTGFFDTNHRRLRLIYEGERIYRIIVRDKGKEYCMEIGGYFYESGQNPSSIEKLVSRFPNKEENLEMLNRWNKLFNILGEIAKKICNSKK